MECVLWRHIVMSWRHSVTLWHDHIWEYKIDDIFEFGNPDYYRNKKIISLARLQAEIGTACLMTSWRHFVTLFHHANTTTIIKLSSATKEITETKMKSALEHICRLKWRQLVSWRHVVAADPQRNSIIGYKQWARKNQWARSRSAVDPQCFQ